MLRPKLICEEVKDPSSKAIWVMIEDVREMIFSLITHQGKLILIYENQMEEK